MKVPAIWESAMTTDLTGVLRQISLLRSVADEDLEAIIPASQLRAFRRSQVVSTTG